MDASFPVPVCFDVINIDNRRRVVGCSSCALLTMMMITMVVIMLHLVCVINISSPADYRLMSCIRHSN